MKIPTFQLVTTLLLIFSAGMLSEIQAECMYFDLTKELPRIPIIVEATVIKANNDHGELNSCAGQPEECQYRFTIQVHRVLKGKLEKAEQTFSYNYWLGCPGVDTFTSGQRRIFFLNQAGELYGNSCAFGSISWDDSEAKSVLYSHLKK